MSIQNLLIVGGGISGLNAAAAIRTENPDIHVDLVEINPQIADLGGVGLSVLGNALIALDKIGAAEVCVSRGVPANQQTIRNVAGEVLTSVDSSILGGERWPAAVGIGRSTFHGILAERAKALGTAIRCGLTVQTLVATASGVDVTFTDGSRANYDLVIGADGLFSATRQMIFPEAEGPIATGQGIWRAFAKRPEGVNTTQLFVGGPQGLVGVCPISEDGCYVYCLHGAGPNERRDPNKFAVEMREKLNGYGGMIPALAEQITDNALVNYRPLQGIFLPGDWYSGRVLLIGDASHIGPPNLAQGAAMGIEDGAVLAEELAQGGTHQTIFQRFMQRRKERARFVFDVSCQIAKAEAEHDKSFNMLATMSHANKFLSQPF